MLLFGIFKHWLTLVINFVRYLTSTLHAGICIYMTRMDCENLISIWLLLFEIGFINDWKILIKFLVRLRVVWHNFALFKLGWFVSKSMAVQSILVNQMTGYEALLLMIRFVFLNNVFYLIIKPTKTIHSNRAPTKFNSRIFFILCRIVMKIGHVVDGRKCQGLTPSDFSFLRWEMSEMLWKDLAKRVHFLPQNGLNCDKTKATLKSKDVHPCA